MVWYQNYLILSKIGSKLAYNSIRINKVSVY